MNTLKILSISGGGILAKWILYFLTKIEEDLSISIKDCFDVIGGISSGSLITGGFMINLTPFQMFELYNKMSNQVFKKQLTMLKKSILGLRGKSFHDNNDLKIVLKQFLKDELKFKDISDTKGYYISAVNIDTNEVKVFAKNLNSSLNTPDSLILDAILASSCPPFYLGPVKTKENEMLIDGGVSTVNPALEILVSSIKEKPLNQYNYKVVSLSCPKFKLPPFTKLKGQKKMFYLLANMKMEIDHNRANLFVSAIIGKENSYFSQPEFPDAVDFDWIVPNRFDKYFNHFYYLERDKFIKFLKENKIINSDIQPKLKINEKTKIDLLIDEEMRKWKNKEIKDNYFKYFEKLF